MPTASTSAGTQKWLSVSTARRFGVFKKRPYLSRCGVQTRRDCTTTGGDFKAVKNRPIGPAGDRKVQADTRDVAQASRPLWPRLS
jgi:hypothetical protein